MSTSNLKLSDSGLAVAEREIQPSRSFDFEENRTSSKGCYRTPLQERAAIVLCVDIISCTVAAGIAFVAWAYLTDRNIDEVPALFKSKWHWAPLAFAVWYMTAWMVDLYDVTISSIKRIVAQRVSIAMLLSSIGYMGAYFLFPEYVPRTFLLLFVVAAGPAVFFARALVLSHHDRFPSTHRLLLVGESETERELNQVLQRLVRFNFKIVERIDEPGLAQLHFINDGDGLLSHARKHNIHEIVVSREANSDEVLRELVHCQSNGIRISSMPELYRKLSRKIPVEHVDSAWVMRLLQDRLLFTRLQLTIKRAFDLCGALIGLPLFFISYPLIAIAIKLDTKGPVFYKQLRSGQAGKPFYIVKFRTMRTDAEKNGPQWSKDNDNRITRVGKILRKTRLDEVPQVLNVLRGDMSLVGPRPERPEIEVDLDHQIPHYFIRRLVKPGITGWAQVHYKYGNSVRDSLVKLEYDAYYVRYWSLLMDLYTLFRTVGVVLGSKGH